MSDLDYQGKWVSAPQWSEEDQLWWDPLWCLLPNGLGQCDDPAGPTRRVLGFVNDGKETGTSRN